MFKYIHIFFNISVLIYINIYIYIYIYICLLFVCFVGFFDEIDNLASVN